MLTPSEFYFVRHGQTDWNRARRVQGSTDIPLNENGLAQARRARDLMAGIEIATVCASPLARALETAKIIQARMGARLQVLEGLAECNWGALEGQVEGAWMDDWRTGACVPDDAETYPRFVQRALDAINEALTKPGPVLIVAHGAVYWTVQKHATLGPEVDIPNATPIHHKPPRDDFPWWTATAVGAD